MKAIELFNELKFILERKENEDLEVLVPSHGIGGPYIKVKSISPGFDWYYGKLMINLEITPSTISPNVYSALREMYLKKVSNYNKINQGETLEAKYKTKTFTGKSKYECLLWLNKMVEEEIKLK